MEINVEEMNETDQILEEIDEIAKDENAYGWYIKDMQDEFENDMKEGNAFVITEKKGLDKKNSERLEGGIYSPKFGTIWQDENAFAELHRCKCGEKQGKMFTGLSCDICGHKVKFRDKNVKMTAYFILEEYYIIHPTLFRMIASIIGKKKLISILEADWEAGTDGNPIKPIINEKTRNVDKYIHIGILEFMNRFDEILEFFYLKKKDKLEVYEFVKENRSKVFIRHIPVISLILRPIVLNDENFDYSSVNRQYAVLSSKIYDLNNKYNQLNRANEKIVINSLLKIQLKMDTVTTVLQQSLNKKSGQIRNNIQGSRYNYTCRAVIVSNSYCNINEVEFPYLGFLMMYRPEILHYLCNLYNLTINEAFTLWQKALVKFDESVYTIMQYIVEKNDIYIILNRNPSLNYGSLLRMKIKKVKKNYNDLTISIPLNICGVLAADFDGDALNTISLKDMELVNAYELYDPRTNMIISRNDGLFDNSFNLIKDQIISIHQLCKLSHKVHHVRVHRITKKEEKIHKVRVYRIKDE